MCSFCYTRKLADHKSKSPRFGVYLVNPLGVGILYILYNLFADLVKYIFLFQPNKLLEHKGQGILVQGAQVAMSAQEVQINGCNLNWSWSWFLNLCKVFTKLMFICFQP